MKEIKLVHIVIAGILILLSLAIVHWVILPKGGLPTAAELSEEAEQPEELPILPQVDRYNSAPAPSFAEGLPPFEESRGQDLPETKDPIENNGKAEL